MLATKMRVIVHSISSTTIRQKPIPSSHLLSPFNVVWRSDLKKTNIVTTFSGKEVFGFDPLSYLQ